MPTLPNRVPLLHVPRAMRGLGCAALLLAGLANAEPATFMEPAARGATEHLDSGTVNQRALDPGWWRESVAVFGSLWDGARSHLAENRPDWLHHLTRRTSGIAMPETVGPYVVLQDDRADGVDLMTLRYRLAGQGALKAYAGAGLNHAQYFVDGADAGPSRLTRRSRRSGVGPTAELGAELALSDRVRLNADLRWVDLDARADLLHSAYGPMAAAPVTLGLSLGYRFR